MEKEKIEQFLNMLNSVANEDYKEMLTYVPDGIEHRGSQYKIAEDFESVGSYEDDARYAHPAQWKIKELVLRKAIDMLKNEKIELKDVHLGPNREDIEKKSTKIRQWIFANGIFEIKIPPKNDKK